MKCYMNTDSPILAFLPSWKMDWKFQYFLGVQGETQTLYNMILCKLTVCSHDSSHIWLARSNRCTSMMCLWVKQIVRKLQNNWYGSVSQISLSNHKTMLQSRLDLIKDIKCMNGSYEHIKSNSKQCEDTSGSQYTVHEWPLIRSLTSLK